MNLTASKMFSRGTVYTVLSLNAALVLFPIIYILANSLMDTSEIIQKYSLISELQKKTQIGRPVLGFSLIPDQVSLMQYYTLLLRKPNYLAMFWNSTILTVPVVLGQVIIASLAAFAFAKMRFPLRNTLFFVYIIVMMMPFQVTLVPNYIILKQLKLLDTYLSVVLPGIFSTFGVFLLKQYMSYIPDEYCDAAKIDGAGNIRTFLQVILPQCKAALASLAILTFIDNWNMVEQPVVFLRNETMHPLSIFLARINTFEPGVAFSAGLIYMIPPLLVFLYGENYFVRGIQLSGMK